MLDAALRKLIDPPFAATAAQIARLPVNPSLLSATGFAMGLVAFVCIVAHRPLAGLGFLVLNLICDGVATPLGRLMGAGERVAYLRVVFALVLRACIPLAFALADPTRALSAAFLLVGFISEGATRFGPAMFGARDERSTPVGASEDVVLFLAFVIACLMPAWFSVVAYGLGVLCFVVTGVRIAAAVERLK